MYRRLVIVIVIDTVIVIVIVTPQPSFRQKGEIKLDKCDHLAYVQRLTLQEVEAEPLPLYSTLCKTLHLCAPNPLTPPIVAKSDLNSTEQYFATKN